MAWEQEGFKPTGCVAGADLSAKQFYVVKLDSTVNQVVLAGAGELVYGVLQNKPALAAQATVMRSGVSKCVAGAAIALGAEVAADANGKVVTATTGDRVIGVARAAAAADLNVIPVDLMIGPVSP